MEDTYEMLMGMAPETEEKESEDDSLETNLLISILSTVSRIEGMMASQATQKQTMPELPIVSSPQLSSMDFPPISF